MSSLKRLVTYIFPFICWCSLPGCSVQNSSDPITKTSTFPRTIERARKDKRQFIMYSGKDTFTVTSIMIENAKRDFTVQLDRVDSAHRANINDNKSLPGKQLFLFMLDSTSYTLDEPHTIPLAKVAKIQLSN